MTVDDICHYVIPSEAIKVGISFSDTLQLQRTMSTPDFLGQRFAKNANVASRLAVDEVVLALIRDDLDVVPLGVLSGVGAYIWELIDGQKCVRDLRDCLVAEYEISAEQAQADLVEFLQSLVQMGAIVTV